MKRRTSNMIASVLSVSVLGLQALPIFAETAEQDAAIDVYTVQDFLNYYLSTKSEFIDVNGKVNVTYTPITYVDDTNYWMVLSAKNFYDSLSANVVLIVDGNYYVPKTEEEMNKDWALKQEIDEYFAPNDYFTALVNDALAKDQEIKAAEELARQQELLEQEANEATNDSENKDKEINFTVDSNVDSSNGDEKANEVTDEEQVEVVKVSEGANLAINGNKPESLLDMAKPLEEEEEIVEEQVAVVEEVVVSEEALATVEPAMNEVKSIVPEETVELTLEEAVVPLETIVKQEDSSTTAQDFVNTYLTSSAGNVYTQANAVNFQTILNSLSAWNRLSSANKDQVNSILMNKVGKTYQTLLQEAQTIKYGGTTTSVQTGVHNDVGFFTALCGISAAVFGFIAKRKEM